MIIATISKGNVVKKDKYDQFQTNISNWALH